MKNVFVYKQNIAYILLCESHSLIVISCYYYFHLLLLINHYVSVLSERFEPFVLSWFIFIYQNYFPLQTCFTINLTVNTLDVFLHIFIILLTLFDHLYSLYQWFKPLSSDIRPYWTQKICFEIIIKVAVVFIYSQWVPWYTYIN